MTMIYTIDYQSPVGVIEIASTDEAIYSIMFTERDKPVNHLQDETPAVLELCCSQLDEYFQGKRYTFTFPYTFKGTDFQKNVWKALTKITFAETETYKNIAVSIGNENAIRAVGSANGKNKLNIVIPCHRIIGSNGKLTGYGGGLWRKEWLLQHEKTFKKDMI